MRKYKFKIVVLCLILILGCDKEKSESDLLITNVNIIDVENSKIIRNQNITIVNGKIISIEPSSSSKNSNSKKVIDGTDKFVIPGLWDMHVHYATSNQHPGFRSLFIANGVLGVRDLWGNLNIRDSLVASNSIMPRTFLSGDIIDGPFTLLQGTIQPKSPEDASKIVDSLYENGADFIKVYDDLSKETYQAIAKRCKEINLPFVGHTPNEITAIDASNLGQKSIEHLNGIFESASSEQKKIDSLENIFKDAFLKRDIPNALKTFTSMGRLISSSYSDDELTKLSKILRDNDTYVTPTLLAHYNQWNRKEINFSSDLNLKYIPQQMAEGWKPENEFPTRLFGQETWDVGKSILSTAKKISGRLHEQDVKLLAGTDCGNFYIIPGFSLHDELQLMVDSGLTNGESLKTATINPASYFKMSDSLGTVTKGKMADLVMLNGNPLDNIAYTKEIYAVIQNGNYLDRLQLNKLLKESERN